MTNNNIDKDMSTKEMCDEFDDEVKPGEEILFCPQEQPRMPPGFTQEHTGYNTYQDQCRAGSANQIQYMENLQCQDSANPQSSGHQQALRAGSSFSNSPNHCSISILPNHQKVMFYLPSEHLDKDSRFWQSRQHQSFSGQWLNFPGVTHMVPHRVRELYNSSISDRSYNIDQEHFLITNSPL